MKIAIISFKRDPSIPTIDSDGGAAIVRNLIEGFSKLGHQVNVYTRFENISTEASSKNKRHSQLKSGGHRYKYNGNCTIYRIGYDSYNGKNRNADFKYIRESNTFAVGLKKLLDDHKPDIVHYLHLFSVSGMLNLFKDYKYSKDYFLSLLTPTVGKSYGRNIKEAEDLENMALRKAKTVICSSSYEKDIYVKNHNVNRKKFHVVPHGIDNSIFRMRKKNLNSGKIFNIICPGAIRKGKAQHEVIKIINILNLKGINARAIFIGNIQDPNYYSKLQELCEYYSLDYYLSKKFRKKFLSDRFHYKIIFNSGIQQKTLARILNQCDIAIIPSKDETYGMTTYECITSGLHTFCYDIPGYSDFLNTTKNVIAISPSLGYSKLCDSVIRFLSTYTDQYVVPHTSVNILSNNSLDTYPKRLLKIYR